jgi:8-oxo-dGTP diphosphatase
MKTLHTITEHDIFPDAPQSDPTHFGKRRAARAVMTDDAGRVALLHVKNDGYHKLPGGGVDEGEELAEGLSRELMEELGCTARIIGEVGIIVEYWDRERTVQTSYCYLAKRYGEMHQPSLTEEEAARGFEVVWAKDLEDAISLLTSDSSSSYDGKHITPRDLAFLREARKNAATLCGATQE